MSQPIAAGVREALAGIWAAALKTGDAPVQDDDDFFEQGGDSLAMVALLQEIEAGFGVDLAVEELFAEDFTVGAAARALDGALRTVGAMGALGDVGSSR
jgi:acyl carrier protein